MNNKKLKQIIILLGETNNYNYQGDYFLKKTNTIMTVKYLYETNKFIEGYLNKVYEITLKNNSHEFTFEFHQSANDSKLNIIPNSYSVLSCLQKYTVETDLKDFCREFGYEHKYYEADKNRFLINKESKKIHEACKNEFKNVLKLFKYELEILQEIS